MGKEDLHSAREVLAVPRDEVVDHEGGLRDQASRTREVGLENREIASYKRWSKDGWRWSRQDRRRSPRKGFAG